MASSSSSTTHIAFLKAKLKTWERQFKSVEGREPTKSDIKSNPEIAKMYSAYNSLGRAGARKSEGLPKPSSSTGTVDGLDKHSTPTKQQRGESSRKRVGTAPEAKKPSPKTYAHVNSPSKFRKLVQDHSPRKHSHSRKLRADQGTGTPKANPFDSESGGGKGSPALFADLLLEAKNTPRTKARRFLIGAGSPLKPKPQFQTLEPVESATGGLSSFLKSQVQLLPDDTQAEENEDEDEEVLGPSPFKPKSNVAFRPLFDDPEADSDLKLSPVNKPKQPKWKISSRTPFISSSQSQSPATAFSNQPESAQRDPIKSDKKKPFALGIKRKRILLGEEEKNFYEDLPETNASKTRTVTRGINKKKKVEPSKPNPVKNRKANLAVPASSSSKPQQAPLESDGSEPEQRAQLPDLPFGDPDQPGVYTELDTFVFTAQPPAQSDAAPADRFASKSKQSKAINKGKGKAKETGDDHLAPAAQSSMPVKLGTRRVLVRPYRPVEVDGMGKNSNYETFIDRPPDIELDGSPSFDANSDEGDSGNAENSNDDSLSDDGQLLAEGDIQISEDLMNILSIQDGLAGQDRRTLAREKAREERVRRILDGKSIMERTLSTSEPLKPSSKINLLKSKSKAPIFNRVITKQSTGVDDDLKFELALEDRENEEEEAEEAADEDDDWEENPEGWKEVDDGLYLDDDFIT